jgi:hypothetical protein
MDLMDPDVILTIVRADRPLDGVAVESKNAQILSAFILNDQIATI